MSYELDISKLHPSDKARELNSKKRHDPEKHDAYPCFFCDSPIKKGFDHFVTITDGGVTMVPDRRFTDVNDPGFMESYPVGPACWRKVKKAFKDKFGCRLEAVRKAGP
jgi:hypothetical protein